MLLLCSANWRSGIKKNCIIFIVNNIRYGMLSWAMLGYTSTHSCKHTQNQPSVPDTITWLICFHKCFETYTQGGGEAKIRVWVQPHIEHQLQVYSWRHAYPRRVDLACFKTLVLQWVRSKGGGGCKFRQGVKTPTSQMKPCSIIWTLGTETIGLWEHKYGNEMAHSILRRIHCTHQ